MAAAVSEAGGIGFIGSGNDQSNLEEQLRKTKERLQNSSLKNTDGILPIGVGFINWGADLDITARLVSEYKPAAIWLFAPRQMSTLADWSERIRKVSDGRTKIWIQVGSVQSALEAARQCRPDVLVLQGSDAGGHGLNKGCGIVSLIPEAIDALQSAVSSGDIPNMPLIIATGGIVEGRGAAAAFTLGADGVVLGTRYLVAHEAEIADGYKQELIRASDGGQNTIRSKVYDTLRGTTDWPEEYGGRGVINQSYHDAQSGMDWDENRKLYENAVKIGDSGWGPAGRMTTYAGTGVGLVKRVQSSAEITAEVRDDVLKVLENARSRLVT